MHRKLTTGTLAAALTIAMCAPMTANAQSKDSGYGEVPKSFFTRDLSWASNDASWKKITKQTNKKAPTLAIGDFFENSKDKGAQLDKMKGKIVLIDFWATWCGPCIANIPHTNEIAEKYRDQGVEVIGVCNTRGAETMAQTAKKHDMFFPTGADDANKTAQAFGVQWWPYYVIIDRDGVVRAAGIEASKVEKTIKKLLKYQPKPKAVAENADTERNEVTAIDASWLEGNGARRNKLARISNQTPPALNVANWINADAMSLESLQGKVVMLDFWATWCGPCIASIPHTNELQEKYKDDGLVIIGVCHERGHEKMAQTVKDKGIEYPVVADTDGKTVKAFAVDSFPDYYFIDRAGNLRVADAMNGNIEDVIKMLLAEKE